MADGDAWLEALGEQLRESEKQIPALAAAQVKLAEADVSGVVELQQEAATWYSAITREDTEKTRTWTCTQEVWSHPFLVPKVDSAIYEVDLSRVS